MNTRAILIDRAMGSQRPSLASSADVQALEAHVARLGVLQAVPLDRIRRVE